jgi:hypothetical protein
MNEQDKDLLGSVANKVTGILGSVNPDEIDNYTRAQEALDKSYRIRTVLAVWKDEQGLDRVLRSRYAKILLGFLGFEILLASVLIFFIGFGIFQIKEWIINVFFVGVFSQASSLVVVIVKYLFPQIKAEFLKLLKEI